MNAKITRTLIMTGMILVAISISAKAQEIKKIPDSLMKKRIFKVEFFSPLSGNLTFGYEQHLKDFISLETKIGLIGAGIQQYPDSEKEKGIFISGGPKFKLQPVYATDGMYSTHLLRGGYIRPELTVGTFSVQRGSEYYYDDYDDNATFLSFIINYGNQYILGNSFSIDWYVGMGYGVASEDVGYYYKSVIGDSSFPVAFNCGFTIGILSK